MLFSTHLVESEADKVTTNRKPQDVHGEPLIKSYLGDLPLVPAFFKAWPTFPISRGSLKMASSVGKMGDGP